MNRPSNMPPKHATKFWDCELFILADAPITPPDPFAPISPDLRNMLVQLDGNDDAQLDAVAGIKALLWASNLSLCDLAARVEGAVPRRAFQ